jgi:dTMP kinase
MQKKKAFYIGIDSADGAGKDFQTEWLHQAFFAAEIPCLVVNEPKATSDGRTLYEMATTGEANRWTGFAEACLWSAARSKANQEFIQPALKRGEWVITHRTPLTTVAYQGYGRGGDIPLLRQMQYAAAEKWPDFFILLDLDPAIGMARKTSQKGIDGLDRFEREGLQLQERVRYGLLEEAKHLKVPCSIVDASRSKSEVHHAILTEINKQFSLGLKPLI